jgi:hypothetical protein
MTPEPILFLVSNGLLEHKDRMGATIWEYLWLIDKVTKDEPDGQGKFNGVVLGGKPISAVAIATDLKEHVNSARANLKTLAESGYIVRTPARDSKYSYVVTNSKKWFWNRPALTENGNRGVTETCEGGSQKPVRGVTENGNPYKERHDSDTTKNKTLSSNPDGFDQAVLEVWAYYVTVLNRSPQTTLTETRKRMARARLKECFARAREPQLENATNVMKLCVDRLKASKWHNGNNPGGKKYLTWEILFRNREQFEKWINDENYVEGAA